MLNYSGSVLCCATVNWVIEFVSVSQCVCVEGDKREGGEEVAPDAATNTGSQWESTAIATE